MMQASIGIRTDKQETVVEIIADDYGKESYEAKLYYEGPLVYGGTPRSLRVHVNRDERVLFSPKTMSLIPANLKVPFEEAWQTSMLFLKKVVKS